MKWTNTENKIRHILECVINFRTVDIEYDIYCRNVFDTNTHTQPNTSFREKKEFIQKNECFQRPHHLDM